MVVDDIKRFKEIEEACDGVASNRQLTLNHTLQNEYIVCCSTVSAKLMFSIKSITFVTCVITNLKARPVVDYCSKYISSAR